MGSVVPITPMIGNEIQKTTDDRQQTTDGVFAPEVQLAQSLSAVGRMAAVVQRLCGYAILRCVGRAN